MDDQTEPVPKKPRLPAWLLGLIIAAVVFALTLLLFQALDFGDNPVLDGVIRSTLTL